MARKRMIDPEFWSDEEIGNWSYVARLFYIGLWNFADDEGRFKAADALLKAQIFPYDKKIDIEKLKKELNRKIQWYEFEGLQYGFICNFKKHQRIDRPTESKLPVPPPFTEPSPNPRRILAESSPNPRGVVLSNISKDNISKDKLIEDIVSDLNEVLKSNYKTDSKTTISFIQARLNDGFTFEDFKKVHRNMLKQWGTDDKMKAFLRPITLYSRKFESYLNIKQSSSTITALNETLQKVKDWEKNSVGPDTKTKVEIDKLITDTAQTMKND